MLIDSSSDKKKKIVKLQVAITMSEQHRQSGINNNGYINMDRGNLYASLASCVLVNTCVFNINSLGDRLWILPIAWQKNNLYSEHCKY